ncbi:MAG: cytochrome P450 [Solirubrobacterales bacterium]|nr:cytochrome P450 [Solirubrobacterales bacterium]
MTETMTPPAGPAVRDAWPSSPAGPLAAGATGRLPPALPLSRGAQTARFLGRPLAYLFGAQRQLGETFAFEVVHREEPIILTAHPDHVRSLLTAPAALVPSMAAESPLRPILGASSVLTANGPRHLRQRKLLLPPFHGDSIATYAAAIRRVAEREVDRWRVGDEFRMAERMQAVTLEVIMAGLFGVEGEPAAGSPERGLRDATRRTLKLSEGRAWQVLEVLSATHTEPQGLMKVIFDRVDAHYYRTIAARRAIPEAERGTDVLSLLLATRDEEGRALDDREVRDELMTLVLAGHETTANQLAWTFERLVRVPDAHAALRDAVRGGDGHAYVEATIHEAMRVRPVIPIIGRRVQAPWQLGEYVIPAGHPVSVALPLLHHREDLYPQPFRFAPERFLGVKPNTYTWLPFGGGTRRCLGASLAIAEQRIVLETIARRVDLEAVDPRPEREQHRNVTMIPRDGGTVRVRRLAEAA